VKFVDTSAPSPVEAPDAARARAIALVADTLGELMRFWNFTPSMGRIWAVLYLSPEPLDAEQIEARASLSAGNVSQTLQELVHWGVVTRVAAPVGSKRRLFAAETDILALVARVFRDRELRLVERSVAQLEEALRLLENEGRGEDPAAFLQSRFLVTRVRNLLELAHTGHRIVQKLARTGSADLSLLRGALAGRVRGALRRR
jgi:DNA-binding transcriptional regulator GbsR (MarR family)